MAQRGRRKTARKRLGHIESRRVAKLFRATKAFQLTYATPIPKEVTINAQLIASLKAVDSGIKNKAIPATKFVSETFRPECYISGSGSYDLFAVECKRLTSNAAAKKLYKEGISQALLYLQRYKVVFLVLYDFTTGAKYHAAFGPGNRLESRFSGWTQKELGLRIIVLKP